MWRRLSWDGERLAGAAGSTSAVVRRSILACCDNNGLAPSVWEKSSSVLNKVKKSSACLSQLCNNSYLLQLWHFLAIRQLFIILLLNAATSVRAAGRWVQVILMATTSNGEPTREARQRFTRWFLIVWTGHGWWIVAPFIERQMLFGFVERQSQLTVASCRNQAGASITQVVIFIVVRWNVIVIVIFWWTPAVLRAYRTPCWLRMFQLLMWFVQMLGMIDRRGVCDQVIVVDDAVDVEDLWIVETRFLVVVHRVQVVRMLTLRQWDDTIARLACHRLRVERVGSRWNTVGTWQWIFPWNGLLFICKREKRKQPVN